VDIKRGGSPDSNLNFYDPMVSGAKGWVEHEFVLFIICRIATWNKVAKWVNIQQDICYLKKPMTTIVIRHPFPDCNNLIINSMNLSLFFEKLFSSMSKKKFLTPSFSVVKLFLLRHSRQGKISQSVLSVPSLISYLLVTPVALSLPLECNTQIGSGLIRSCLLQLP
jgi:hypothetical protein